MEQRRLIAVAFIFFSFGLSLELLKDLGRKSPLTKPTSSLRLEDYNVQFGTERVELQSPEIHNTPDFFPAPKLNGVKVAGPQANAVAKKDDKKNTKKKDDKKQAENKKKKKKKKKKTDDPNKNDDSMIAKNNSAKKNDGFGNNINAGGYYVDQTGAVNPNAKDDKNTPKTLAEWENHLLREPSYEEVKKFIELYRTSEVTPDIFYAVAKSMLEDQRPQMKQLGLVLLDSSPSVTSFDMLTEYYYKEAHNSEFRTQMDRQLSNYTRQEYFNVLVAGLSREKSLATNHTSVVLLSRAIDRYRQEVRRTTANQTSGSQNQGSQTPGAQTPNPIPQNQTPQQNPPGTPQPQQGTVRPNRAQTLFGRFQGPLRQLIAENDPQLSTDANQVFIQLMEILS